MKHGAIGASRQLIPAVFACLLFCNMERPSVAAEGLVAQTDGQLADAVIAAVVESGDCEDVSGLFGRGAAFFKTIKGKFPALPERKRFDLVSAVCSVGIDPKLPRNTWLRSSALTEFLLWVATEDAEQRVRDEAAQCLAKRTPDVYFRYWSRETLALAAKHGTSYDAILLGKTGAMEAKQLLMEDAELRKADPVGVDMALAKLGDLGRSEQFVRRFEGALDQREKTELAWQLGYIGDAACAVALAQSVRNPMQVSRGAATKPFGLVAFEALGAIYPDNQVFFVPADGRTPPEWWDRAEAWLQAHLKIEWKEPRPSVTYTTITPTSLPPAPPVPVLPNSK